MVAIQQAISLNLIKNELDSTLKRAEKNLETFIDDRSDNAPLGACIESFHEIAGICKVINLDGVVQLATELEVLSRSVLEGRIVGDGDNQLSAIGQGIMMIEKYLEYVLLKQGVCPPLLVDTINVVRRANGLPLVGEALFFAGEADRGRHPDAPVNEVPAAEVPGLARRLRHMYQVGLLGVVRNESPVTSCKLMARALERVDRLCGTAVASNEFWWLARAAVECLAIEGLEINLTRKNLLSRIDRQLKSLVYDGEKALSQPADPVLCKELLYLVALADKRSDTASQVELHYELRRYGLSDAALREERNVMSGPGGSVIRTVAETLKTEMAEVKQRLEKAVKGVENGFASASEGLFGVASTLLMLGLIKESQAVKKQAESVKGWSVESVDVESAGFQELIDELLAAENAVARLEKTYSGQGAEADGGRVSLYEFDDAKRTVIVECRSGLGMAKRALTSYLETNFDSGHLANVPDALTAIGGSLTFLGLRRVRGILDSAVQYVRDRLLAAGVDKPTQNDLETFADVISSVDYFLEGIEEQKPIGESVLEIAEEALNELGFPIMQSA